MIQKHPQHDCNFFLGGDKNAASLTLDFHTEIKKLSGWSKVLTEDVDHLLIF